MSARQRYIDEVLNEDKRIYHQVFERQKEQAKVFTDSVLPKSLRDIDVEYRVDNEAAKFNSLLENKLVLAEGLMVSQLPGVAKGDKIERLVLGTNDLTRNYNELVKQAIRPDARNQTKDVVKSKLQELSPQIDSLVYAIPQVMLNIIANPPLSGAERNPAAKYKLLVPSLGNLGLQTALYMNIQKQLKTNSFKVIDNYDMQTQYKNLVNSLSPNNAKEAVLKELLESYQRGQQPEIGPGLQQRIVAAEAERGRPLTPLERQQQYGAEESKSAEPENLEAPLSSLSTTELLRLPEALLPLFAKRPTKDSGDILGRPEYDKFNSLPEIKKVQITEKLAGEIINTARKLTVARKLFKELINRKYLPIKPKATSAAAAAEEEATPVEEARRVAPLGPELVPTGPPTITMETTIPDEGPSVVDIPTEGRGRPRFANRISRALGFDDRKNEMYDR